MIEGGALPRLWLRIRLIRTIEGGALAEEEEGGGEGREEDSAIPCSFFVVGNICLRFPQLIPGLSIFNVFWDLSFSLSLTRKLSSPALLSVPGFRKRSSHVIISRANSISKTFSFSCRS